METIRELTADETALAWPTIGELRLELAEEEMFVRVVNEQLRPRGYRLVGVFEADTDGAVAVAGFRVAESLAWGRHLYVDDLVARDGRRGRGHGTRLLAWLREEARRLECEQLHLDSGVQRTDAHRFYAREGMTHSAHHYACRIER